MISDDDRRVLAEIERHLQEDRDLGRSLARATRRPVPWARRVWWAVLLTSLVLMLGLAALDVPTAALESAAVAAVACAALRLTRPTPADRTGPGRYRADGDRR